MPAYAGLGPEILTISSDPISALDPRIPAHLGRRLLPQHLWAAGLAARVQLGHPLQPLSASPFRFLGFGVWPGSGFALCIRHGLQLAGQGQKGGLLHAVPLLQVQSHLCAVSRPCHGDSLHSGLRCGPVLRAHVRGSKVSCAHLTQRPPPQAADGGQACHASGTAGKDMGK